MNFIEFIKEIDFFGKVPELYIKHKPKQVTLMGRILTSIFIVIYIIIVGYKLYRMFQRVDITFYDSYLSNDNIHSINITNDNFYLLLSVNNDLGLPFIDESIYYPKAYFIDEEIKEIKLERCNINKFGSKYKYLLKDYDLENYYCLNQVNFTFKSYINSIKLKIFPCKNSTVNNNHCKTREIIDEYLNGKNFEIYFEDILITPLDFEHPVKERINLIYTSVFKIFGQYIYAEMQLVNIETSINIIGFDYFTNPKLETYIKYDKLEIIPQPGYDLSDETNDNPICEIEFQLNDKILSEKRQYIQLIDILSEIGGLMELIKSFFGFINSVILNIIYKKIMANNLFSFDIEKRRILIKRDNNLLYEFNDNNNKEDKKDENRIISSTTLKKWKNKKNKLEIFNSWNTHIKNKNSEKDFFDEVNICNRGSHPKKNKIKVLFFGKSRNNKNDISPDENYSIIDDFNSTGVLLSLCFCFKIKRGNMYNILLKETMRVIKEKLDIFNIFRNLCLIEHSTIDINDIKNSLIMTMSEECSNLLAEMKE